MKLIILSWSTLIFLLQKNNCSCENVPFKCPPTEFIVGVINEWTIWFDKDNFLKGPGLIHFMIACSANPHTWHYKINQTDPSREHRFYKRPFLYAQLCQEGKVSGIVSAIQNVYHKQLGYPSNVNAMLLECCEDPIPGYDFVLNQLGFDTQAREQAQRCPPMQGVCGINMDIRRAKTDGSNYGFRHFAPICCHLNWKE